MYHVKIAPAPRDEIQGIGLNKFISAIMRLRFDVNAHHVKAGALVSASRATGFAERIE